MVFTAFFRTSADVDSCLCALRGRYTTKTEFEQLLDINIDCKGVLKFEDKEKMQIYKVTFDKKKHMLRLDVQEIPLPF